MKYIFILLVLLPIFCFGQYPPTDNFTSIGGVGEWFNSSGDGDMCVDLTTFLCYNCTGNYTSNNWYSWQSSNYGTQFVDDGCDSINFTFSVTFNIRNQFQFWWFDGGWSGAVIPSSGIWTIDLPSTVTDFSFDLVTGNGNGGRNGKYVHIDYATIDCYLTPLPIELLYFDVSNDNGDIIIDWLTASEINNVYFVIQRSNNIDDWYDVTTVDGNGTTNEIYRYSVIDLNPYYGVSYYRLQQVDYDGKTTYHPIKSININREEIDFNIYPNPTDGLIYINNIMDYDNDINITITNSLGQIVFNQTGKINGVINLMLIDVGYYIVTIKSDDYFNQEIIIKK